MGELLHLDVSIVKNNFLPLSPLLWRYIAWSNCLCFSLCNSNTALLLTDYLWQVSVDLLLGSFYEHTTVVRLSDDACFSILRSLIDYPALIYRTTWNMRLTSEAQYLSPISSYYASSCCLILSLSLGTSGLSRTEVPTYVHARVAVDLTPGGWSDVR